MKAIYNPETANLGAVNLHLPRVAASVVVWMESYEVVDFAVSCSFWDGIASQVRAVWEPYSNDGSRGKEQTKKNRLSVFGTICHCKIHCSGIQQKTLL